MIQQKNPFKRYIVGAVIIGIALTIGVMAISSFEQANEGVYRVQSRTRTNQQDHQAARRLG